MNKKGTITPFINNRNDVSRKYITETFYLDSIDTKVDEAGQSYTSFRALAQQIDTRNDNKRIYTKEAIDEALAIVDVQIKKNAVFCLIDHPDTFERVKIKNVGARVTGIEVIDNNIYITGVFIDNAAFREYLKPLIDSKSRIGISVRGYTINDGNPEWNNEKDALVYKKGYRIDGWDFVLQPAVDEANVLTLEEKENQIKNTKEEKIMDFKTLSELKANFPHLFVEDDMARKNALDAISNEKKALDDKLKAALDSNTALAAKFDEKSKEVETLGAKLKTTEASLDSVKAEIDGIKFQSELSKIIADCKYKEFIAVPSHIKNAEDAKKYVADEVTRLDAFLAKVKPGEAVTPATPATPAADSATPAKTTAMDAQDMWIALGSDKNIATAKK